MIDNKGKFIASDLAAHSAKVVTVEDKFRDGLCRRGILYDSDLNNIMDYVKRKFNERNQQAGLQPYVNTQIDWKAESHIYPDSFYNATLIIIKMIAVEWAEKNKPEAIWLTALKK